MFIPSVCLARAVGLSDQVLDDPKQQCMCLDKEGKPVTGPMRNKSLTWTHKVGTDEYGWYVTCGLYCYAKNVTGGSC